MEVNWKAKKLLDTELHKEAQSNHKNLITLC